MVSFWRQVFVLLSLSISPGCIYIEGWDDMRMGRGSWWGGVRLLFAYTAVCVSCCMKKSINELSLTHLIQPQSFNVTQDSVWERQTILYSWINRSPVNIWPLAWKCVFNNTIAHDKLSQASLTTTGFSCLPTRTHLEHKIWHKLIFLEFFFLGSCNFKVFFSSPFSTKITTLLLSLTARNK